MNMRVYQSWHDDNVRVYVRVVIDYVYNLAIVDGYCSFKDAGINHINYISSDLKCSISHNIFMLVSSSMLVAFALGIEAASFASVASKDRAESPTALPERQNKLKIEN